MAELEGLHKIHVAVVKQITRLQVSLFCCSTPAVASWGPEGISGITFRS